jgi:hypothetical protein
LFSHSFSISCHSIILCSFIPIVFFYVLSWRFMYCWNSKHATAKICFLSQTRMFGYQLLSSRKQTWNQSAVPLICILFISRCVGLRRKELYCARKCNLNNDIDVFWQWTQYECLITKFNSVRFEVLMAVSMKKTIFWDVTPCDLVEVYRCSRGTCFYLPLDEGSNVSRNYQTASHPRIEFSSNLVYLKHEIFALFSGKVTWNLTTYIGYMQPEYRPPSP